MLRDDPRGDWRAVVLAFEGHVVHGCVVGGVEREDVLLRLDVVDKGKLKC